MSSVPGNELKKKLTKENKQTKEFPLRKPMGRVGRTETGELVGVEGNYFM